MGPGLRRDDGEVVLALSIGAVRGLFADLSSLAGDLLMRLYIRPIAPNALKVVIFMAERGIEIETVDVGELAPEDYARISPLRSVPVLETDSGLTITESLTICQYLDS